MSEVTETKMTPFGLKIIYKDGTYIYIDPDKVEDYLGPVEK